MTIMISFSITADSTVGPPVFPETRLLLNALNLMAELVYFIIQTWGLCERR